MPARVLGNGVSPSFLSRLSSAVKEKSCGNMENPCSATSDFSSTDSTTIEPLPHLRPLRAPLVGGDFPNFCRQFAANVIPHRRGNYPHPGFLRNSSRGNVGLRLRGAQNLEAQNVEPIIIDGNYRLGHQSPALPRQPEPVTAIVDQPLEQTYGPNQNLRRFLQSQRPVPLLSAFNGRKRLIAIIGEHSIRGIRPRDLGVQVFDDLPLREEGLGLLRICQLKRPQQQPSGLKFDAHCSTL